MDAEPPHTTSRLARQDDRVQVNGPTVHDELQPPFGGVKGSGYGRFGGQAGIDAFTNPISAPVLPYALTMYAERGDWSSLDIKNKADYEPASDLNAARFFMLAVAVRIEAMPEALGQLEELLASLGSSNEAK